MNFFSIWGPLLPIASIIVTCLVLVIILVIKNFKLFLALLLSFLFAFGLPIMIGLILRSVGYISKNSGGSIPLPTDLFGLFFLVYYAFPVPFSIPVILTVIFYEYIFSRRIKTNQTNNLKPVKKQL